MWIAIQNAVGARQGVGGGPGPTPPPYTPPLDAYPATAAYSVRLLRTAYTGDCMRVRRASDNVEADVGFDSNNEFGLTSPISNTSDAQSYTDFADFVDHTGTPTDAFCRWWYDQSGNANDAGQSTPGSQPQIYDATTGLITENAKPALQLVRDPLKQLTTSAISWSTSFTAATVLHPTDDGNFYIKNWSIGTDATARGYAHISMTGATGIDWQNNDSAMFGDGYASTSLPRIITTGSAFTSGSQALSFLSLNSLAATLHVDGTEPTYRVQQTGNTSADSDILYINGGTSASQGMDGTMQELILWPSNESSNRTPIESNINNFYQISNFPDYTSGFLADYSGAAAAYSVRKLSNTAIKALRVRQTVAPFDELDIGFTPAGDLDEAAIVAFGAGNPLVVSRWYDQSGKSNHAVQETPGLQPQIYNGTAVITDNGKPALSCDLDRFELGSTISLTSGYSAIHVSQQSGRDSASFGTSFNYNYVTLYQNTDVWFYHNTAGRTIPYVVPLNTQQLHWLNWTGSTVGIGIDGGALSTGALSASASINRLLNAAGNTQQGWRGLVQEMIVYPTDKNAAGQRTGIETNVNTYYGVYPTSGFLVDYPGAKAAYSLRKLQNVQQYAIQVQRTTGANDTLDIGFDVNGDLDTQAIIDFGGSDTLGVSIWYDQSRTGNDLTSGLGNQPIIYNGVSVVTEGSRPALSFDKTANQDLQKQLPSGINILDMGSFLVCKSSATPYNHPAGLFLGSTSSQEQNMLAYRTGQITYSSATTGGTLGNTNYNLFSLYSDNASSDVKGYLNGSQLLTGTPTSVAVNWLSVGAFGTVVGTEWDGTIQEAIVFGTSTKADHTAIESNIQTYYGTP